jgi:WD40 repeat protein
VAEVDHGGGLTVWEAMTGQVIGAAPPEGWCSLLALSAGGTRAAFFRIGNGGRLFVWDVLGGTEIATMQGPVTLWDVKAAFTPNGKGLVLFDSERRPVLWQAITGTAVEELAWQGGQASGNFPNLAVSPDGGVLLTVDEANGLRQWNLSSRRQTAEQWLPWESVVYASIAFSPDGSLACVASHHQFVLWDVRNRQMRRTFGRRSASRDRVLPRFAADGRTLFIRAGDELETWDPEEDEARTRLVWRAQELALAAVLPDGRFRTVCAEDGTPRLWPAAALGG